MPAVSYSIDTSGAEQGAQKWAALSQRMVADATRTSQAIERIEQAMRGLGGGGAAGGGIAQQATASAAALDRQAQAHQRVTQAAQASAQSDAQLGQRITQLERAVSAYERELKQAERATAEFNREQARQLSQGLTYLSTLGGAERAFSQYTNAQMRAATALGQTVDRGEVLARVQERIRGTGEKAAEVFSTQAVQARDLRVNMGNLAQQMTALALSGNSALAPLLNISQVMRQIRTVMAGSPLFAGGAAGGGVGGGSGLDRFGEAGGGIAVVNAGLLRLVPLAAAATAGLAALGGLGLAAIAREGAPAEVQLARIEAVIAATGGAAGRTATQVTAFTQGLSTATGIQSQQLNEAAAQLLTFGNVSGDTFERTLRAATDLGSVFGSVGSAAIALGKAVDSPAEGLAGLARVGIRFTEAQLEQINVLVESGHLLEAQALILGEVESRVGGTAEAIGGTLSGAWARLGQSISAALENANDWLGVTGFLSSSLDALATSAENAAWAFGQLAKERNDPQNLLAGVNAEIGRASGDLGSLDPAAQERQRARIADLQRQRDQIFRQIFEAGNADPAAAAASAAAARATDANADAVRKLAEQYRTSSHRAGEYAQAVQDIARLTVAQNLSTEEQAKLVAEAGRRIFGAAEAEDKRGASTRATTQAIGQQAKAMADAEAAFARQTQTLTRQLALGELNARQQAIATAQLEEYDRETAAGLPAQAERLRIVGELAGKLYDQGEAERTAKQAQEESRRAADEALRAQERQQAEAAKLAQEPFLQASRNIQDAFADTFKSIFTDGIDSFSDLGAKVKDIFIDLAAQIAALMVFRPQVVQQAGGLGGVIGSIFGASPAAAGGAGGAVPSFTIPGVGGGNVFAAGGGGGGGFGGLGMLANIGRSLSGITFGSATQSALPGFAVNYLTNQAAAGSWGASSLLGATSPLSGVGGVLGTLAGRAMGLTGSGNPWVDTGLGIAGTIGGGMAGAALGSLAGGAIAASAIGAGSGTAGLGMGLALGAWGGPIGAAIGAILGLVAGTLMKGMFEEDIDYPEFALLTRPANNLTGFARGGSIETPFGFLGADAPRTSGGDLDVASMLGPFAEIDKQIAELMTPAQVAGAAARLQTTQSFGIREFNNSAAQELSPVIQDRLKNILIGAFGDVAQKPWATIWKDAQKEGGGDWNNFNNALVEGVGEWLGQRKQLTDMIDELRGMGPEAKSQTEQALEAIDAIFDAVAKGADQFALSAQDMANAAEAQAAARAKVKTDFEATVQGFFGQQNLIPQTAQAMEAINKSVEELLKNAAIFADPKLDATIQLGGILAEVQLKQGFLGGLSDRVLGLEDPQALAVRQVEAEASTLVKELGGLSLSAVEHAQAMIDIERWKQLSLEEIAEQYAEAAVNSYEQSFRGLADSLYRSTSSQLPAGVVLANAQTTAMEDAFAAKFGDKDALGRLANSLGAWEDAALAAYGATPRYAAVFDQIGMILKTFETDTGGDFGLPAGAGTQGAQITAGITGLAAETATGNQRREQQLDALILEVAALRADNAHLSAQIALLVQSAPERPVAG